MFSASQEPQRWTWTSETQCVGLFTIIIWATIFKTLYSNTPQGKLLLFLRHNIPTYLPSFPPSFLLDSPHTPGGGEGWLFGGGVAHLESDS